MNEQKKGQLLLVIGAIVILGLVGIFVMDYKEQEKIVNEYNALYKEEGTQIVYFGKNSCSYCEMYQPVIDELMEEYDLEYHYVNVSSIGGGKLQSMLEKGKINYEKFGTPTTLIIKDGKALANKIGYMDRETAFAFFKENSLIAKDAVLKPEFENLTDISYSQYENLIKSATPKVIVIGQTTCSHCITAKPYYNEIALEENIDIYYLNYTNMTREEQIDLNSSLTYFEENQDWGTPLMLIVKGGDSVAADSGFMSKSATLSFLKENKVID